MFRPFLPALMYDFAVFHPQDRPMSRLAHAFTVAFDGYLRANGVC